MGLLLLLSPGDGAAIDAFDGRLQVHGALSQQFRTLADGYRVRDHVWFMSKMATKLSIEIETELLRDGIGPFDIVEGFVRLDFQYDCVWRDACHLAPQWNTFGDDVETWPENLADGRNRGVTGVLPNPLTPVEREQPNRGWVTLADIDPFSTLLRLGSEEDVEITFGAVLPARITTKHYKGSLSPLLFQLGPINPGFEIDSTGVLADIPIAEQADLPMRPMLRPRPGNTVPTIFIESPGLRRFIDDYDNPDVNFTENELAWNLGASQQQTKFLREAYLDITMFEGRFQMRLGKQISRWGKTELFRSGTPDQLNPQDLAISNLPSFEDSLIALWQARMIASFYQVGPLEDVRFEVVVNLDHFEPADLGDCGEPYTVFLLCRKQFGLLTHGFSGLGVSGELRPPNWWEDAKGLEFGARLEFRVGRFGVAITDFYGYDDFPTPDYFFQFERNVDPASGRPRVAGGGGPCINDPDGDGLDNGGFFTGLTDCLRPGSSGPANALDWHSGNRQLYDAFCKATQTLEVPGALGSLLPITSCVLSIFNNPDPVPPFGTVPAILAQTLADGDFFNQSGLCLVLCPLIGKGSPFLPPPNDFDPDIATIPLHPGTNDAVNSGATAFVGFLSPEQQALMGCGPFYQIDCNLDGFDLFNVEASVLFQRFAQTEHRALPLQGAIGTRFIPGTGLVQLPGTRSVFTYFDDPVGFRWNPNVDGCVVGLTNLGSFGTQVRADLISRGLSAADADQCDVDPGGGPLGYRVPIPNGTPPASRTFFDQNGAEFTVDQIRSMFPTEMAVVSENLGRLLIGLASLIQGPGSGCSVEDPLRCDFYNSFFETTAVQRPEVRSGGNGRFGRRDMTWLAGSAVQLFYERRNVLGVSVDFAEDRTKTTWGIDFTWLEDAPYINTRADRGFSREDTLNLTMSIDRPTFINFLNANRTVFFNSQIFIRYIPNYQRRDTFDVDGPFAMLATLTAFTGFWQDRLMTFLTLIHEVESNSGGQIFTMMYRFSESFSVTVGLSTFYGPPRRTRVIERSPVTRFHCCDFTERSNFQGVSAISERDELFVSIRKSF